MELHCSSVRVVVESQAQRGEGFVEAQQQEVVGGYRSHLGREGGEPWLIVESDGSMVRTGELEPHPEGGLSPKSHHPRKRRQTQWREVRLSAVQIPEKERRYGAVLGSPQKVGEQMFALALERGYGEDTWVHGVGDGAPWIAEQIAEVFPRHRYLLDRYHLLEHLHAGAGALSGGDPSSAKAWVGEQIAYIDQGKVAEVVAQCRSKGGEPQTTP